MDYKLRTMEKLLLCKHFTPCAVKTKVIKLVIGNLPQGTYPKLQKQAMSTKSPLSSAKIGSQKAKPSEQIQANNKYY